MFEFIWNTIFFLIALGILVTVHEFGHFWVARKSGVKVLRFAIGFGKIIWSKTGKDGTEYVISLIPLGGYVKMLDEREDTVKQPEKHLAFNNKSLKKRFAIVAAGPVANFIFAILCFWVMYLYGIPALKPIIGENTVNFNREDEIIAINGNPANTWQNVNLQLINQAGNKVVLTVKNSKNQIKNIDLDLTNWIINKNSSLNDIGLKPYQPTMYLTISKVVKGSAADNAGIKSGDNIISANSKELNNWQELVKIIQNNPNKKIKLEIERKNSLINIDLIPQIKIYQNTKIGYAGISPVIDKIPSTYLLKQKYNLFDALIKSADQTWTLTKLTTTMLFKLLTGNISLNTIGGPISIAKGAGATAHYGITQFLGFLALISINLAIMNLLPLPILDGGHLLYFLIEGISGKKISERSQKISFKFGIILLLSLTMIAIFNDLTQL